MRARGAELAFGTSDVLVKGLALSGNVTYVDPKTLAMSGRASADGRRADAAIGKQLPNIPKWRSTATAMYRPNERFTFTLAGRYSSQALHDARQRRRALQHLPGLLRVVRDGHASVNYRVNENWSTSLGVDNLLDRKYFLFHPFPHRTFLVGLKYGVQ